MLWEFAMRFSSQLHIFRRYCGSLSVEELYSSIAVGIRFFQQNQDCISDQFPVCAQRGFGSKNRFILETGFS
jgi:hypothetical protein